MDDLSPRGRVVRLAAAGLGGLIAAGSVVGPVSLQAEEYLPEEDPSQQQEVSVSADDVDWSEREETAIRNWHLDADDLPSEEEEALPEVPEDLVPYFHEKIGQIAADYEGRLPASADMRRYSPRADALRTMVREAAGRIISGETDQIRRELLALGGAAGQRTFREYLAALQGRPGAWADARREALYAEGKLPIPLAGPDREQENQNTGAGSGRPASSVQEFLGGRLASGPSSQEEEAKSIYTVPEDPADWTALPVSPALYAFTMDFPADSGRMETKGGISLFPGLKNYLSDINRRIQAPEQKQAYSRSGAGTAGGEVYDQRTVPADSAAQGDLAAAEPSGAEFHQSVPAYGPAAQTTAQSVSQKRRRTVLIGDSRTVGMEMYVGGDEDTYWSAANSMGYNWMVSTGVPAVEDLIGEDTDVVILMGVNDLGNVSRYVSYMNEKAAEWKERGAQTWFVSVTPVDDRRSPNAKNARIESFNTYMQENMEGIRYIDAYNRIRSSFGSPDGIHFDRATYQEIYRIIRFHLYCGWYTENGLWFWFENGEPRTGWQYLDNSWQYFDGNGVRWIRDGRVGEVVLAPYPETGMLDPYQGIYH